MEHLYTAHTKLIENKIYYFVKKLMVLPELKGLPEIVVGYGMHTDFEKACSIAGIHDSETRQMLLLEMEQQQKPQKPIVKHTVQIADTVNRRLAELAAEALN